MTNKERKQLAKKAKFQREVIAMGGTVDDANNAAADGDNQIQGGRDFFDLVSIINCHILGGGGGIGAGAEIGGQFTVSQQAKSAAQIAQQENAIDIKVGHVYALNIIERM